MRLFPRFILLSTALTAYAVEYDAAAFSKVKFDYIVVGGGTTGLTVAATLSQDSRAVVGVIEAGERLYDDNVLIPGFAGTILNNPKYDWQFFSVPQDHVNNRQIQLARGKILGGTSVLNYLGYTRATTNEYNGIVELGNPGWGATNLFNLMKKAENWTAPANPDFIQNYGVCNDSENHGRSGALKTTSSTLFSDLQPPFLKAFDNLGVPINRAPYGGYTVGGWASDRTIDAQNRSRSFAANAFYEPNRERKNLILLTGAQATKVNFGHPNGGDISATGVTFVGRDQHTYIAQASREIVLSAGSLKSPQLLELSGEINDDIRGGPSSKSCLLSGIGNPQLLNKLGIETLIELPGVGENLQDHPGVNQYFQAIDSAFTFDKLSTPEGVAEEYKLYVQNRTGLLSTFSSALAFLPWSNFMSEQEISQLKTELDAALAADSTKYNTPAYKLQRKWLDDDSVPQLEVILIPRSAITNQGTDTNGKFYTFNTLLTHSWARGNVHVNSTDGLAPPVVDTSYLSSPADIDVKVFVKALRYGFKLAGTEPMKSVTKGVVSPVENATDAELIQHLKTRLGPNWHFIGTAAMLPREDKGVVDPDFKVYGTKNLRIADASILPIHIAAHPVATLYGMGIKAGCTILNNC
ncbi:hypothetical protein PQX77_009746 [Marasmius sp. AFHP31]|nr:hypothetical protein PQX77_009746 [Marasmius sp. AFHP31]